jgi:triacylglycerol lipase
MSSTSVGAAAVPTRIYLTPGLFGFARLAGFDYLQHVQRALAERFERKGRSVEIRVVDVHPSASIRRRAARLVHLVAETSGSSGGPIHLLGHSTGGLDLRLVASPSARLEEDTEDRLG